MFPYNVDTCIDNTMTAQVFALKIKGYTYHVSDGKLYCYQLNTTYFVVLKLNN